MIIGYARVSTKEQHLDRQLTALSSYKPLDRTFTDKQSGKDFARAGYQEMKSIVSEGDEVVIKELDRLGRNKDEIKKELEWFKFHGVTVRILDLPTSLIDFQGQAWIGDMINNILIEVLGAVAEQERKKIKQRQAEGLAAKKARGDWDDYGRPRKDIPNILDYIKAQRSGEMTVSQICSELGISKATWYNKVKEAV